MLQQELTITYGICRSLEPDGLVVGEDARHNTKLHRWATSERILTQSTLNADDDDERRMGSIH